MQDIGGAAAGAARGSEQIGRGASGCAQTGGRGWRILLKELRKLKAKLIFSQERAAARRLEAAAREIEAQKRQKAMDISGNKLDLSGEARKNKVIVAKQRQY